jgi:hypothetical protein
MVQFKPMPELDDNQTYAVWAGKIKMQPGVTEEPWKTGAPACALSVLPSGWSDCTIGFHTTASQSFSTLEACIYLGDNLLGPGRPRGVVRAVYAVCTLQKS